jgi:hypothetical protein
MPALQQLQLVQDIRRHVAVLQSIKLHGRQFASET